MTSSASPKTHKAAVLYGGKDLRLLQVPTPDLQPHEARIAPRATGICGTDQHYYQNGRNGIYKIEEPLILGHEAAGKVVAVGSNVTNIKVGDRVAVEPQLACWQCQLCRTGRYNLCPHMRFNGSASAKPPAQGSLQEVWSHPANLCYKLPDSVSFAEGAVVEPLAVALHSVRKCNLKPGQTALVAGAGAVGLLCARIAKISGASSVVMIDIDEARLEFAKKHKIADKTYQMPLSGLEGESSSDFSLRLGEKIKEDFGVEVVDTALECTGVQSCLNLCIGMVTPGSKVIMVGMGSPVQELNIGVALVREVEILGVWRYTNAFQAAIDLIAAGMVDVKAMISHQFDMDNVVDALELALRRPPDLIKCVITSMGGNIGD